MPARRDPNPVKGEGDFEFEGAAYRFVFDWDATVAWESATDSSFLEFLTRLAFAGRGGPMPRLHHLGEFMRCGLLRHHPDVDAETGARMFLDNAVQQVAMAATGHAMPDSDAEDGVAEPGESSGPARAGGSSRSSASGSKRAGKKKRSGARLRG